MKTPLSSATTAAVVISVALLVISAPIYVSGAEADDSNDKTTASTDQHRATSAFRGRSDIAQPLDIADQQSGLADEEPPSSLRRYLGDIPSYDEILNIFSRKAGKKNKKKKKKRNKNKKKQQKKDDVSSSDDNNGISDDDKRVKNSDLGFLWHLWYTKGIKYEQRGSDFCVRCQGSKCEMDDPVVTNHCNPNDSEMRWEFVKVGDGKGLMKTRYSSLCLEMNDEKMFRLKKCDEDEERQWFLGFRYNGKFKLHPYKRNNEKKKQCISMLHHPLAKKKPTDGEEIRSQPCSKPERTQTVYWDADFRDEVEEEIGTKDYKCNSKKNRCGECQGDCSSDDDCEKGLKCFQRNEDGWRIGVEKGWHPNAWEKIPGCKGMGVYGRDYCVKKELYYDP